MIGFSKSLAREIGSRGITVNVVAPGFIDTDMTKVLPEEKRAAMLDRCRSGGSATAQDIANAVLFLASAGGAYITGETLHVNGGMVMDVKTAVDWPNIDSHTIATHVRAVP